MCCSEKCAPKILIKFIYINAFPLRCLIRIRRKGMDLRAQCGMGEATKKNNINIIFPIAWKNKFHWIRKMYWKVRIESTPTQIKFNDIEIIVQTQTNSNRMYVKRSMTIPLILVWVSLLFNKFETSLNQWCYKLLLMGWLLMSVTLKIELNCFQKNFNNFYSKKIKKLLKLQQGSLN